MFNNKVRAKTFFLENYTSNEPQIQKKVLRSLIQDYCIILRQSKIIEI